MALKPRFGAPLKEEGVDSEPVHHNASRASGANKTCRNKGLRPPASASMGTEAVPAPASDVPSAVA